VVGKKGRIWDAGGIQEHNDRMEQENKKRKEREVEEELERLIREEAEKKRRDVWEYITKKNNETMNRLKSSSS
jgi:hypothetical protein